VDLTVTLRGFDFPVTLPARHFFILGIEITPHPACALPVLPGFGTGEADWC
jgi:hypothetical protein